MTVGLVIVSLVALAGFCDAYVLTVTARYPDSVGVALGLRGDTVLSWYKTVPMNHTGANKWSASVFFGESNVGSVLSFKIMANTSYFQTGANEKVTLPRSNVCVEVFPWFGNQNGSYSIMANLASSELNNSRSVIVYLPPSYSENSEKRFRHVLVMHDGQNLFNDSTSFSGISWDVGGTLDQMILSGAAEEILVVGLYNTPARDWEYTYSYDPSEGFGGRGDAYLDWIERAVLPWTRGNLRLAADKEVQWHILGSSLGGLISCYAGWTRPHVWSSSGCMSSSFWWNSMDFLQTVLPSHAVPSPQTSHVFYIDTGTAEGSDPSLQVAQTQQVVSAILKLGYALGTDEFFYVADGGQHNEYYWRQRFDIPMSVLFPKQFASQCEQ